MVSIVSGLNLALCVLIIQLTTVGAAEFKCEQDGLFGNPDSCLKFIICAHGERQDFDCPQGMSWHGDKGLCDTTDLSKCTATAASSGGSEDVFQQHLLSLLADFKPCHAGETTPGTGTTVSGGGTSENPGQGGNGTTPGNSGNNGGSTTTERSYHPPSNTTDGGSSTGNPGGNPTTPTNPGQGGNGSTPRSGDGSSTPMPTTVPSPTCPACPIPTEKPCPTAAACPALPTCPSAPKCDACPVATEKVCPTVAPCPTSVPDNLMCDDGWKYFAATKSCYFLGYPNKTITSDDAKQECTKEGATLTSIHSDAENTFIFNMVSAASTATQFSALIGLYRTGPGVNDFANYDKTPVDYKRWAETQPDNRGANEACSEMYIRYSAALDSYWNDLPCTKDRQAYVCKKAAKTVGDCPACPTQKPTTCPATPTCPPVPSCPTPAPAPKCPEQPKTTCPDGWKYFNSTESCYFIGKTPLNATDAQKYCRSQGGDLASVHSDEENNLILNYTVSIVSSTPGYLVWLGSYRTGPDAANFENYDGTPMDYTHWRAGMPDNYKSYQYCTAVYATHAGLYTQWDDDNCIQPHAYVCKKAVNKIE